MGRGKFKKVAGGGEAGSRIGFRRRPEGEGGEPGGDAEGEAGSSRQHENDDDEEEEEEEPEVKTKGVAALIEVANPNAGGKQAIKASAVDLDATQELSRRERELLEANRQKERYWKMHEAGQTAEAKADLERLQAIKKQREDAARKREEEKAAKDASKVKK